MNLKDSIKRLTIIKGAPLPDVSNPKSLIRRSLNHLDLPIEEKKEFDDFFDFEEELSEMESSRELAKKAYGASTFLEGAKDSEEDTGKLFILEEIPMSATIPTSLNILEPIIILEQTDNTDDHKMTIGSHPDKVRCEYIKRNKKQCKNKIPYGNNLCLSHAQLIKNN